MLLQNRVYDRVIVPFKSKSLAGVIHKCKKRGYIWVGTKGKEVRKYFDVLENLCDNLYSMILFLLMFYFLLLIEASHGENWIWSARV